MILLVFCDLFHFSLMAESFGISDTNHMILYFRLNRNNNRGNLRHWVGNFKFGPSLLPGKQRLSSLKTSCVFASVSMCKDTCSKSHAVYFLLLEVQ